MNSSPKAVITAGFTTCRRSDMKTTRGKYGLVLLLLYLAAVAFCCFWDFHDIPEAERFFLGIPMDKVVHFIMFLPFPFLVFLAFKKPSVPWKSALFVIITFIAGCLVAAATEIGQTFISYRSGDPMDFKADSLALAVSSITALIVDVLCQRKR